ncbi:PIG-L deacetylase family protein [Pseudodesulfovibrio sp.]|uniref:PIG-L deacetylase family protein n=1 Tax=unclassified Pseudodesulfovibrio TaxID=2661612 RepID=UPI003B00E48D
MDKTAKQVLVIAPHLDDEVLGCGCAILHHVAQGDRVHVVFAAHRVYNHAYDDTAMAIQKDHAEKARSILGYHGAVYLDLPDERLDACVQDIIIPLEEAVGTINPQIVYSPFCQDNNQDHRAVAGAVQVVLRPMSSAVERWLMYETASSTEQAPNVGAPIFAPTVYLHAASLLEAKTAALACYEDENKPYPHPRSSEGLRALAMKRGMEAGMDMAEAFMMVRERI